MKPIELSALLTLTLLVLYPDPRADDKAPAEKPADRGHRLRPVRGGQPGLQTAHRHRHLSPMANGLEVDLIGAIHIADKSYYDTLNESFKGYDALLYEMVGSERKGHCSPATSTRWPRQQPDPLAPSDDAEDTRARLPARAGSTTPRRISSMPTWTQRRSSRCKQSAMRGC